MQRLVGLLRRVRERPPSGSASAPCAAAASKLQENGRGGLHSAAANGDLARLQRRWWWKRLRINRRDANKQTPLHLACVNGHADVVQFLAEKKCQLNPRDNFKKSPLMKAVEHQHKDCAVILLKHGANPDLKGSGGNTALHLAALIPSKSLVELLLEHNADIEAKNKLGYTPLAVAIMDRCEEMVEFLLQKGANVHAQDVHKRTTFMLAVVTGDLNLTRLLLRHGANASQKDDCGNTAMHYANLNTSAAIQKELEEYVARGRMEECSAESSAVLASSSSGTAADSPLGTPALTGAVRILHHGGGVLPAAGAEQEDHFDSSSENEVLPLLEMDSKGPREVLADVQLPAADRHGVCVQPLAEEHSNGVLPTAAGAEQEEDDDSPFDSEMDSEGPREVLTDVQLPAAGRHGVCAQPLAEERGNGVLPTAAGAKQEEDDDSPFDSETDSEGPREVLADVRLPAADRHGVCAQPLAEERSNGVLPTAAGAEQEEDDDSPFDSETDSEGPREVLADVRLPAADRHGVCAQPLAEERSNGVLPTAAGAEQEEDDDSPFDSETDSKGPREVLTDAWLPTARRHEVCAQPLAEERGNGVLPTAAGAGQEEDDDSPFDSETDSEGPREVLANVQLPAAGRHGVCAQPLAEERGNGVLPTAAGAKQEEDDDSPFDSETDSEGPREVLADMRLPAADRHGVCAQPLAEERSNGVLPTAAGAEQEEDDDSPFDSETDSKGPREVLTDAWLPTARRHEVCAQPLAEERGNGVLPTAAGAGQEEDDDSPFDSEMDSEGPREVLANVRLPAAGRHGVCAQPLAEERGNGVLPTAAGAKQEEDDDSPFDSETDSEGPREVLADMRLPAADRHGVCAQPLAEERGNGVLPTAAGAEQEEDDDSPFDSETDLEGPRDVLADVRLPAAGRHGVCAQPLAEERGNGVLPTAAGAEQEEDDDSPFDSETDSEGPREVLSNVRLPAAGRHGVCAQPLAEEHGNGVLPTAAGAEQEEDDDSSSENEVLSLLEVSALAREELLLKKDASTQADSQSDQQRWVRQLVQELADALKKKSLAEASLEAKERCSRDLQEEKLRLQKELDRSKAKLQELKERHIRTECYAESLKNAIKNKERELTTSMNLWGLLVASSGTAAIPELEERIQRLQVGKARLKARARQQAKTIEALQKDLQASASARNGLEDSITGFQTTRTAKEHQHRQCGSESKEVKKLAKRKCQSEALLDEMRGKNMALKEERTRLKMLLEGCQTKLMAYAGRKREPQLSFWREMKNSCSEVANEVGKLRRKSQLNLQHGE